MNDNLHKRIYKQIGNEVLERYISDPIKNLALCNDCGVSRCRQSLVDVMTSALLDRQPDGTLKVKVYRKPTHTEQYLNFSSHHPLEHKLSVVRTLLHRAETVVTDPADKAEEIAHVKNALKNCGYQDWTFFRGQPKEKDSSSQNRDTETANKGFVTLPYIEGLSEKLRRAFRTAGVSTTFKPQNTPRSALVAPKDKTEPVKQSGIVYQIDCADCDASYIGESARKLEKRLSEHKSTAGSSKSAVREHVVRFKGHQIDWGNVKVLERENS
ncbi:uncharacterized protein [Amphiura filiformis]|uniref:uncharacterized protein n=1 Tax=Amphiura filiformis TaxID=82378 RepID=UPI003B210BC7